MTRWTEEVVLKFIELLQKENILWDPVHEQHKDKYKCFDAWCRIKDSLSHNGYAKFSVDELKKKKDGLMNTFRSLNAKKQKSDKSGVGADEIYVPNWYAFEPMAKFIRKTIEIRPKPNMHIPTYNVNYATEETATVNNAQVGTTPDIPNPGASAQALRKSCKRSSHTRTIYDEGELEALNVMRSFQEKCRKKDDCALFADMIAEKLRAFDNSTRELMMLEIHRFIVNTSMHSSQPLSSLPMTSPNEPHFTWTTPYHPNLEPTTSIATHYSDSNSNSSNSSLSTQSQHIPSAPPSIHIHLGNGTVSNAVNEINLQTESFVKMESE